MNNYKIIIKQDSNAQSPRNSCNLGTLLTWYSHFGLSDKDALIGLKNIIETSDVDTEYWEPWDYLNWLNKNSADFITCQVYVYEHDGIELSTIPFSCNWDSRQIGFIYASKIDVLKAFDVPVVSVKLITDIIDSFEAELKVYTQYINGMLEHIPSKCPAAKVEVIY